MIIIENVCEINYYKYEHISVFAHFWGCEILTVSVTRSGVNSTE